MSSVVQVLRVRKLKSYRPDGVKWLEKAADKNNDTAQNMLGVIYENGDGVSPGLLSGRVLVSQGSAEWQ